ncbi:MAG TPA: hypothetical protein VFY99_03240, partial [Solirubrobacterales bacterium]
DPVLVRIYLDDATCTAPADATGTVAQFNGGGIAVGVPSDATSTIRAAAVDAAGNQSGCSNAAAYIEDSTAPDTAIGSGPAGTVATNDVTFTYAGVPVADAASFECRLDSGDFAACPASGAEFADLPDGAHTFEVRATDAAGNTDATPAAASFSVDTTVTPPVGDLLAPDTVLEKKPPRKIKTDERKVRVRFRFAGSDETTPQSALSFECKFDGKPVDDCESPIRRKAKLGKHVFTAAAVDAAGNTDPSPARSRFKVIPES